ncbi:hypothetical protein [Winogradskyella ursingii]|uniref:hypothetical protein n=1 Tax=Winogradskyella ursingii TaxID=2686079 RepID=UPI0015C80127|nr:hypothetical protein [Winogradskyella ursingii]
MGIIKYYDFKDSECFIFDEFIINQIKEGVVIEPHHNDKLNEVIQEHFSGKDMVYVSNRVKSYSVNPLVYPETKQIPNLIAIAMIPLTETMRKSAQYEKQFFDKPYQIFDSLSKAIQWVHQILNEKVTKDKLN